MNYPVDFRNVDRTLEFYDEVVDIQKEAENYLLSFYWCREVRNCFLYTNIGRVFCIFLFEIINSSSPKDNFVWVIVGDIPPMYLDTFGPKSTVEVTELYIDLAEDWIACIKEGSSIDECYPFNAEPTLELAELLEKKISFMKNNVIENIEDVMLQVGK